MCLTARLFARGVDDALRHLLSNDQQKLPGLSKTLIERRWLGDLVVVRDEQKRVAVIAIPARDAVGRTVTVGVECVRMRVSAKPVRALRRRGWRERETKEQDTGDRPPEILRIARH